MPNKKLTTGQRGEEIASQYLTKNGYKVIERNHRQKWGEIDIICLDKSGDLVLVEVKTVWGPDPWVSAEEQMTSAKTKKFKRAASIYATNFLKKDTYNRSFRLDVIAIELNGNDCRLEHYENIS